MKSHSFKNSSTISHHCQGFTLLEILVAITLTALVLGNLFVLQSQSKHLSLKAQTQLLHTINQRAYLNAAWSSDHELDSYLDEFAQMGYTLDNKQSLKKIEVQKQSQKIFLQSFDIVNEHREVILHSVRIQNTPISYY